MHKQQQQQQLQQPPVLVHLPKQKVKQDESQYPVFSSGQVSGQSSSSPFIDPNPYAKIGQMNSKSKEITIGRESENEKSPFSSKQQSNSQNKQQYQQLLQEQSSKQTGSAHQKLKRQPMGISPFSEANLSDEPQAMMMGQRQFVSGHQLINPSRGGGASSSAVSLVSDIKGNQRMSSNVKLKNHMSSEYRDEEKDVVLQMTKISDFHKNQQSQSQSKQNSGNRFPRVLVHAESLEWEESEKKVQATDAAVAIPTASQQSSATKTQQLQLIAQQSSSKKESQRKSSRKPSLISNNLQPNATNSNAAPLYIDIGSTPNNGQVQHTQQMRRSRGSENVGAIAAAGIGGVDQHARPFELVEIRNGKLILNSDLLEQVVLKYEGNISFVSVQGLPNIGKSRFLNTFLDDQRNSKRFYERNSSQQGGTEGVILWGLPIYNSQSNTHTFVMDVQGIDLSEELNLKLQLLVLLLSDILVFMSDKPLKHALEQDLAFLLELEKRLSFPILDVACIDYMPAIAIFATEGRSNSHGIEYTSDSEEDEQQLHLQFNSNGGGGGISSNREDSIHDLSKKRHFEGDLKLSKYFHYLDLTHAQSSSDSLKIKKILNGVFREKFCFLRPKNNTQEVESSELNSKQFHSAPDKESFLQRIGGPMQVSGKPNNQFILNGPSTIELSPIDSPLEHHHSTPHSHSHATATVAPWQPLLKQQRPSHRNQTRQQLPDRYSTSSGGGIPIMYSTQQSQQQYFESTVNSRQKHHHSSRQFNSVQGRASYQGKLLHQTQQGIRRTGYQDYVINNNNMMNGSEALDEFAFLRKIIRLASNQKKFKQISLNAYTLCEYVRLLVEEINEGSCIDPRITASRAVVCELQRVSQMCISDHAEKIHALVSFDSHQSMQSAMSSLLSIRTSTCYLFTRNVGRFQADREYSKLYATALDELKRIINHREEQIFHLFHNTSYGVNEERLKIQQLCEAIQQQQQQKSQIQQNGQVYGNQKYISGGTPLTVGGGGSGGGAGVVVQGTALKDCVMNFKESISTVHKDFLTYGREIDSIAKTRVFAQQCVKILHTKLSTFNTTYAKLYNDKQIEILEQDSNKKIYEKYLVRFSIIKQKSKIFDDMTKNTINEIDNLRDLERVIRDRFIKSYNSQRNNRQNQTQLQRILEKEEQIKILEKKASKMRKSKLVPISPGVPAMNSNPLLLNDNLIEAQNLIDLNGVSNRGAGGPIAPHSASANVVTTVPAEDGYGIGDMNVVVDANNITIPPLNLSQKIPDFSQSSRRYG